MSKLRTATLLLAATTGLSVAANALPVRVVITPKRMTAHDRLVRHQAKMNEHTSQFLGSIAQVKKDAEALISIRQALSLKEEQDRLERQQLDDLSLSILNALSRKD